MKKSGKALDQNGLEELALRYVSRYATTRHKLKTYLHRKLYEREWKGEPPADTDAMVNQMVERFAELGYIDDILFAKNKAAALVRRGYGKRRVTQALYQSGIEEGDDRDALDYSEKKKWEAARTFARKKSIGPFAQEQQDQDKCRKQLQAFLRAGHDFDIASRFVFAKPGETIEPEY